ncbi:MAG TPA: DUF2690 domain-containing protein [Pilimelia sp.]|nr:DUF2690 domain-containing protein [Pilimelia sp.]
MWRGPRRLLTAAVTLAVGVIATLAVPGSPAAADGGGPVTCHIVCDGQDPNTAGYEDSSGVFRRCTDARTIYSVDLGSAGNAELRYSGRCRMAWARGVGTIRVEGFWANGAWRDKYYPAWGCCPAIGITPALNDANLLARACVYDYGLAAWQCGRKY